MATPTDERRRAPGDHVGWCDWWGFEAVAADRSLAVAVRFALVPRTGTAWVVVAACGPATGTGSLTVVEQQARAPRGALLEVRADALWCEISCMEPLERWAVGLEAFALGLDDPADAWGSAHGDRVPLGLDLEWVATSTASDVDLGDGAYEQAAVVAGEVLVGDAAIELEGAGRRDRGWGVHPLAGLPAVAGGSATAAPGPWVALALDPSGGGGEQLVAGTPAGGRWSWAVVSRS